MQPLTLMRRPTLAHTFTFGRGGGGGTYTGGGGTQGAITSPRSAQPLTLIRRPALAHTSALLVAGVATVAIAAGTVASDTAVAAPARSLRIVFIGRNLHLKAIKCTRGRPRIFVIAAPGTTL